MQITHPLNTKASTWYLKANGMSLHIDRCRITRNNHTVWPWRIWFENYILINAYGVSKPEISIEDLPEPKYFSPQKSKVANYGENDNFYLRNNHGTNAFLTSFWNNTFRQASNLFPLASWPLAPNTATKLVSYRLWWKLIKTEYVWE